jgi:hypothetical protein
MPYSADPFFFPLETLEATLLADEGVSPLGSREMLAEVKKNLSLYLIS